MNTTTSSGGRRVAARRVLLAATTILAAGIIIPVAAQQVPTESVSQSTSDNQSDQSTAPQAAMPAKQVQSPDNAAGSGPQSNLCDGCGDPPSSSGGGDIVPPQIYTLTPGGLNVAEGGITYKQVDLSIGTLELERFYDGVPFDPDGPPQNDHDPEQMPFGVHAGHNFEIYVSPTYVKANTTPGTITYPQHWHAVVHLGGGSSGTYWQSNFTSTGNLLADDGEAEKGVLAFNNGAYTYTDQSGTVYQFNPNVHVGGLPSGVDFAHTQRVASITYPDGRVRSFSYDAGGLLKLVSDSSGNALVFDYNGSGLIAAACGFNTSRSYVAATSTCAGAALKTSYGYSGSGLTSVTDVLQQVTSYSYGATGGLLSCIQPPGYAGCKIAIAVVNGRNIEQTMADGSKWKVGGGYTMARNDENYVAADGEVERYVIDPAGKTSYHTYTGSTPYNATDANGHTTQYVFAGGSDNYEVTNQNVHMGSLLQEVDLPEGNKYLANTNGPFHALLEQRLRAKPNPDGSASSLPDQVVTYGYDYGQTAASIAKPTSRTDTRGNTTNWSYYGFGMPHWEMQPAPSSGAARPLKLYSYGQKNAWVLDGGGNLVASGGTIWMPASEIQCQTVAGSNNGNPVCDAGAPEVTTTYEYGPDGTADNLRLRGKVVSADGQSLRTCYRYDWQGNKIAETAPRAGLGSCPA